MLSALLSTADHLVGLAHVRPNLERGAALRASAHELATIAQAYDVASFDAPDRVPAFDLRPVRRDRVNDDVVEVFDVAWPSEYTPVTPFASSAPAAARLLLHRRRAARGVVILVHGYLGGPYAIEERLWPLRAMLARGYDVALMTLPGHGVRRGRRFPSRDPRVTNEGVRQSIHDLRVLMSLMRERFTARHIGAMGMSLGGYLVALLATLEPSLAFAVPVVPLADLSSFSHGRFDAALGQSRVHRAISPLLRRSLVPPESVVVLGAEADAIAPLAHARALAAHLEAPLETFAGGHVLQLGRAAALRSAIERVME